MTYLGKIDHQCFTQGCYREMLQDVCDLGPVSQEEGVGSRSAILENSASSRWANDKDVPPKCATLWHSLQTSL